MEELIEFIEKNSLYYKIEYTPQSWTTNYVIEIDNGFARGTGKTLKKCLESTKENLLEAINKRDSFLNKRINNARHR